MATEEQKSMLVRMGSWYSPFERRKELGCSTAGGVAMEGW